MILTAVPPMGVYETLFKFATATATYMGEPGTHPWAQGYPITTQVPGGPPLPRHIELQPSDLKYPRAEGEPTLRRAIASYYNSFYEAGVSMENVAVFAGGRPAILTVLAFLRKEFTVVLEDTEYSPYYDMLNVLQRSVSLIPSNPDNRFRPWPDSYRRLPSGDQTQLVLLKSNPCNPTGVSLRGEELRQLLDAFRGEQRGAIIDEAYEFYGDPEPESALRYVGDIESTNFFIVGAATKGLQVPGLRVGWVVSARRHIEIFRNYSSFGMGGVSRASQICVASLLQGERVRRARSAISRYYTRQRARYAEGLTQLGFELFTGNGGFYHWARVPGQLSGDQLNQRLFRHKAGVLPGYLCDMGRDGMQSSRLDRMIRFSFGPLEPDSFDGDMAILARCL